MSEQVEIAGGSIARMSDVLAVEVNGELQTVEVKGPDPDVWGEDHCGPIAADAPVVLDDFEVKGPDAFWHQAQAYADAAQAARHQPTTTE